jgi:hypothetical protein
VLTAYDDARAAVAAVSSPSKAAYCQRHGYDFVQRTSKDFDRSRPPAWSKLRFIADLLPYYDWVFWTDCDSLVMDQSCPLEAFLLDERCSHLILPHDDLGLGVHHVNTGNFFARNSKCETLGAERLPRQRGTRSAVGQMRVALLDGVWGRARARRHFSPNSVPGTATWNVLTAPADSLLSHSRCCSGSASGPRPSR